VQDHEGGLAVDITPLDPTIWEAMAKQIDVDFGDGTANGLIRNGLPVLIGKSSSQSLCLIPRNWPKHLDIGSDEFQMVSMGLHLGEIHGERLKLGVSILDRLAALTKSKVVVSRKGAEAFTYGRSIIKESVIDVGQELRRGQMVVVEDRGGNAIGLASLSVDTSKLERLGSDELVAKNLVDVGLYLRRSG
jgi:ribosome biogenesis protein Nip4